MSGSIVRTYAPDKILMLVNAVPMTGFAEDSFISIAPNADMSTIQVGADGEVARSLGTNRTCTVTLSLQQTSPSNDVLSALIDVDAVTGGVLFPVTVQDLLGRSIFVASQGWISRRPTIAFGREAGNREWTILTGAASVWFSGGSF